MHLAASTIVMRREQPSYPNWQRKRIQNPCSVSSNLTEGTNTTPVPFPDGPRFPMGPVSRWALPGHYPWEPDGPPRRHFSEQ